jgi:hypothetical protein
VGLTRHTSLASQSCGCGQVASRNTLLPRHLIKEELESTLLSILANYPLLPSNNHPLPVLPPLPRASPRAGISIKLTPSLFDRASLHAAATTSTLCGDSVCQVLVRF